MTGTFHCNYRDSPNLQSARAKSNREDQNRTPIANSAQNQGDHDSSNPTTEIAAARPPSIKVRSNMVPEIEVADSALVSC